MTRQAKDGSWQGQSVAIVDNPYAALNGHIDMGGKFDWQDVDGELLKQAMGSVTRKGDAFSTAINRSRTEGTLTILHGGQRPFWRVTTVQEANDLLRQLANL